MPRSPLARFAAGAAVAATILWLGGRAGSLPDGGAGSLSPCRVSPRRATYFLLLVQKKVGKEKHVMS
jgi:hypothetical protein